jgi:hypothetical protein
LNRSHFFILFGLGMILIARPAFSQLPATKQTSRLENAAGENNSSARAEYERIRKERRAQARSLLISLATDARSFRDQTLRARSLARIADALWDSDPEQGRTLFRRAWEAAEIADRESKEPLNLRREILTLIARRDRALAEEFLQHMKEEQDKTDGGNSKGDEWALSEALEQRLRLAGSLLRAGDIEHALQFADSLLGTVTLSTVDFLSQLRENDPGAADQRYARMLANTAASMKADANTISVLSSYIFTPHTYVVFSTDGGASSMAPRSPLPPANVSSSLRLAFFQTAGAVLLRPQPPPEQDQSSTGIPGKYMVVRRLMPLFEQYAPKEIRDAMRSQLESLNSLVTEPVRKEDIDWAQRGQTSEKPLADQAQPLLDQIEHAKTSAERDELYFNLAVLAVGKDDLKARNYAGSIDENDFRKQAQAWVDASLAISAIKKKKTERALELISTGQLTHIQRLWLMTQTAKLLAKIDREKALSLIDDATTEAGRLEGSDLDRPRGLLGITNALKLLEPSRLGDAMFDAVKAANSTEGFTGEGGGLSLSVRSKSLIINQSEPVPDFDISGIFSELTKSDYEQAVELARGFRGEAPRANATIAIARSVLIEKSGAAPTTPPTPKN